MSLEPCPDSPNCVSTLADATDSVHYMEAVSVSAPAADVLVAVQSAVSAAGGKVTQQSDDRLAAVFTSRVFRFKDDVTFFVDVESQMLHYRSASRTGHSDLGVNRKRMKSLLATITSAL